MQKTKQFLTGVRTHCNSYNSQEFFKDSSGEMFSSTQISAEERGTARYRNTVVLEGVIRYMGLQEHEQLDLVETLVVMQLFRQLLFSGYVIEDNTAKFRYREFNYAIEGISRLEDVKPDFRQFKNRSILALSQRL